MKKLLLSLALAVIGSLAFSQTTTKPLGAVDVSMKQMRVPITDSLYLFSAATGKYYTMPTWANVLKVADFLKPNGVINPGTVSFNNTTYVATIVNPFTYRINGISYTPTQTSETLLAHDITGDRIDIITGTSVGANGSYSHVTGAVSSSPLAPEIPSNTVVIATIYRHSDGTSQVINSGKTEFYSIMGGDLFGSSKIKNGYDLILAAKKTDDDSGDVVFMKNDSLEMARIHSGYDTDNGIYFKYDGLEPSYRALDMKNRVPLIVNDASVKDSTTWSSAKISSKIPYVIDTLTNKNALTFDGYKMIASDAPHQAEGFTITAPNGDLIHPYSRSTTTGHIGNANDIYLIRSTDNGKTWQAPEFVYSSAYGDMNVGGGITDDGKLVIWFDRVDWPAGTLIDAGYIYSTNSSFTTWSSYTPKATITPGSGPYGPMVKAGDGKYLQVLYNIYTAEIFESTDGMSWASKGSLMFDNTSFGNSRKTSEVGIVAITGTNNLIAHVRDDGTTKRTIQYTSTDNGNTWNYVGATNLGALTSASPWLYYDSTRQILITFGTRRLSTTARPTQFQGLGIYSNTVAEVFSNPTAYTIQKEYIRPIPSFQTFYGYPSITKRNDGNYLVVFTESYIPISEREALYLSNERAYLYQFTIKYSPYNYNQQIPSEYGVDNYVFNPFNNRYEPSPSTDALASTPLDKNAVRASITEVPNIQTNGIDNYGYYTGYDLGRLGNNDALHKLHVDDNAVFLAKYYNDSYSSTLASYYMYSPASDGSFLTGTVSGRYGLAAGGATNDPTARLWINTNGQIEWVTAPTTSAGTYDILTRNTSTRLVEKIPSTTFLLPATAVSTYTPLTRALTNGWGVNTIGNLSVDRIISLDSAGAGGVVGKSRFNIALALKENLANKSTSTSLGVSDVLYPTQKAVKTYVDGAIAAGGYVPYTGATGNVNLGSWGISGVSGTFNAVNIGGIRLNLSSSTFGATLGQNDYTYVVNVTGGSVTVNLPDASSNINKIYIIKKSDASANTVTIDPFSSQTIDGSATYTLLLQWKFVQVQSDGANWYIIGQN